MKFRFERTNCSYVDEALRDQRTYKSKEAKAEDRSKKRIGAQEHEQQAINYSFC